MPSPHPLPLPLTQRHRELLDQLTRREQTSQQLLRRLQIVRLAADGAKSGWELAAGLFQGIMQRNVFQQRLALQETLAHCQSLAVEGRLHKQVTRELVTWRAA